MHHPNMAPNIEPNLEIERTYQKYLTDIQKLDLSTLSASLGLLKRQNHYVIPFFNTVFTFTPDGFLSSNKTKPSYDICIVLCKYLLMCPEIDPLDKNLVSFKDFKESGPLTVYFSTDVEQKICNFYSGNIEKFKKACEKVGARSISLEADYDLIMKFDALPQIPMILLFNDKDDEFDAQSKILFEQSAQDYLDAECLAILGNLLFQTISR